MEEEGEDESHFIILQSRSGKEGPGTLAASSSPGKGCPSFPPLKKATLVPADLYTHAHSLRRTSGEDVLHF